MKRIFTLIASLFFTISCLAQIATYNWFNVATPEGSVIRSAKDANDNVYVLLATNIPATIGGTTYHKQFSICGKIQ